MSKPAEMTLELAASLLKHSLRARLLHVYSYSDRAQSPSDLARAWSEPIGNVSYHTRILARAGAITVVHTGQVRGAVEHFYIGTEAGDRVLSLKAAWEQAA